MQYLHGFGRRLKQWRESRKLSISELASRSGLDDRLLMAWETDDGDMRLYPTLEELLELCFATDEPVEFWIDMPDEHLRPEAFDLARGAPEAPLLSLPEDNGVPADLDLVAAVSALEAEMTRLVPSADELELLRRFRRSSPENRKLVMQLMH